jgi:hypothetical protein
MVIDVLVIDHLTLGTSHATGSACRQGHIVQLIFFRARDLADFQNGPGESERGSRFR